MHGIKESRLKKKVLNFDCNVKDFRGKHKNHQKVDECVKNRIPQHINLLPARESHCSQTQKVLNASLSVVKLYHDFINENPDLRYTAK